MKKLLSLILAIVLTITLFTSCAEPAEALTSVYLNLGEKYLTDLNYEEAIVYFNKVIEVEPKNARAYLGSAEAYVAMGDIDSAIAILEQGIEVVDDPTELEAMLAELLGEDEAEAEDEIVPDEVVTDDTVPEDEEVVEEVTAELVYVTSAVYYYNSDGSVISQETYEYDENGNLIKYVLPSGYWEEYEYDASGLMTKQTRYVTDGSVWWWDDFEYDTYGNVSKVIESMDYDSEIITFETLYENTYDTNGWLIVADARYSCTEYEYDSDGNLVSTFYHSTENSQDDFALISEYDSYGELIRETQYWSYVLSDYNLEDLDYIHEFVYERDLNGNIIKVTQYDTDGSVGEWFEYTYTYSSSGEILSRQISEYDEDGTLISIEYQTRIN